MEPRSCPGGGSRPKTKLRHKLYPACSPQSDRGSPCSRKQSRRRRSLTTYHPADLHAAPALQQLPPRTGSPDQEIRGLRLFQTTPRAAAVPGKSQWSGVRRKRPAQLLSSCLSINALFSFRSDKGNCPPKKSLFSLIHYLFIVRCNKLLAAPPCSPHRAHRSSTLEHQHRALRCSSCPSFLTVVVKV